MVGRRRCPPIILCYSYFDCMNPNLSFLICKGDMTAWKLGYSFLSALILCPNGGIKTTSATHLLDILYIYLSDSRHHSHFFESNDH